MKPIARRTGMGSSRGSWPATATLPDEGRSSVATRRSVVVLPAPLGPNSVRKPPRGTVNDTSRSTSRRPKALPRPSTRISGQSQRRPPRPIRQSGSPPERSDRAVSEPSQLPAGSSARRAARAPVTAARSRRGHSDTPPPATRAADAAHTRRTSGKTSSCRRRWRARRVEGILSDDEQVARQAAQDDGAHAPRRPADRRRCAARAGRPAGRRASRRSGRRCAASPAARRPASNPVKRRV